MIKKFATQQKNTKWQRTYLRCCAGTEMYLKQQATFFPERLHIELLETSNHTIILVYPQRNASVMKVN